MKTIPTKRASRCLLSKRQRQLRALLTALFLLTQSVMAQTTFHGNNARTGVYDSVGPKVFNGVQWSFKTEGPIISSPAIANGTVFSGSSDGGFYAIDQSTGHQRWKVMFTDPISSSPAIANGIVYFITYDGIFYALAADTGDIKWRFVTGGERRFEAKGIHGLTPSNQNIADPMDLFLSSPAVVNHRVYFGSSDGHLYALDAETGVLLWSFETGDIVHASPAVANDTVYIGSWDSYFYALDAATGREKWRFKSGDDPVYQNQVGFQSSPAVSNGVVYVGCRDGHVYAIDANTGKKNWDYSTSQSWVNGTPAVRDGVVYVGTSDTFRFHALDAKTGRLIFAFDAHSLIFGSAAIAGDLAYFGAFNGRLYAVDARSGKLAWEFQTDSSRKAPSNMLSPDGVFDKTAMAPMFHNFLDMTLNLSRMFSVGAILSSPVVDQGTIYFGSADGSLYAIH